MMHGRALVKYLAAMEWLAARLAEPVHSRDRPGERRAFHGA